MKRVILEFPNQETMDTFLGQVSDGAMEDICTIEKIDVPDAALSVYEIKMNYVDDTDDDTE